MSEKAPEAFRTISEVADLLDIPQHVLRFWETRFSQIKPLKRGGGRRYYRPEDVDLLRGIRHLLYGEGYTIKGVQRILKDQGIRFVAAIWQEGAAPVPAAPAPAVSAPASISAPPAPVAAPPRPASGPHETVEIPAGASSRRLAPESLRRLRAAIASLEEGKQILRAAGERRK